MNDLISNYLTAVGGIQLIRNIKSHFLLCSIEAKGIHQTWKEFYNYEDKAFKIILESEGRAITVTEGNDERAVRRLNGEEVNLNSPEIESILSTILLIPEINLLDDEYVSTLSDIQLSETDENNILHFTKAPFRYKFEFDRFTFLKKEIHLSTAGEEIPELTISYDDWREINGILYPFQQNYINPHQTSSRDVQLLEIVLSS